MVSGIMRYLKQERAQSWHHMISSKGQHKVACRPQQPHFHKLYNHVGILLLISVFFFSIDFKYLKHINKLLNALLLFE